MVGPDAQKVPGRMRNRLSMQVRMDTGADSDTWFRRLFTEIARVLGQGLQTRR